MSEPTPETLQDRTGLAVAPDPKLELAPGFYPDLPWRVYHALPYANSSTLKHFADSPYHARHYMSHGDTDTDSKAYGRALHAWLLERDTFFDEVAVFEGVWRGMPKKTKANPDGKPPSQATRVEKRDGVQQFLDPTLKTDDARKAFVELEARFATVIRDPDFARIKASAKIIEGQEAARYLLHDAPGYTELTLIWDDSATGMRCKARLDRFVELGVGGKAWPTILDLKQLQLATKEGVKRSAAALDWHVQAGFYCMGARAVFGAEHRFVHVTMEGDAPFAVLPVELDPLDIEQGERDARKYLDTWAECNASGKWPVSELAITPIDLPPWKRARFSDEWGTFA